MTELSAKEWDRIRDRFRRSMMVKTEVYKLAQNIDVNWPLRGTDEIPLKYVPLSYDELMMTPGIAEKPERARLLADILVETMAFDDPFGEMAEHVDSSSKHDESAAKAMRELGIPAEFPIALCNVSQETREFCVNESLTTIGDFIDFTQNMAQSVVVGGDFRAFLNSFVHQDEEAIAHYIPMRIGRKGLFLTEALGQAVDRLGKEEYLYFLEAYEGEPAADDRKGVRKLREDEGNAAKRRIRQELSAVFEWFSEEADLLKDALAEGGTSVDRFFMPLENPNMEKIAKGFARLCLENDEESTKKKSGFFRRLFRR